MSIAPVLGLGVWLVTACGSETNEEGRGDDGGLGSETSPIFGVGGNTTVDGNVYAPGDGAPGTWRASHAARRDHAAVRGLRRQRRRRSRRLAGPRNVSLLPDVSRQVFQTVAARLERAKAHVEELGRLTCAELEAATQVRVAELVAEAKGQYPAAVGRALARIGQRPPVLAAYNELHALSLVRPHRTVTFRGFSADELRAVDAAMMVPHEPGAASGGVPSLPARPDAVHRSS